MPAERVVVRQVRVREIVRLKFAAGIETREVSHRIGISASTVRETLRRF
jgi:DNA-binding transcriptional regulator LsrR (DeoR family)